jgi:hypothetical protein
MQLDLNTYSVNRIPIQDWYRWHGDQRITDIISIQAAGTHCPCIALAFYLAEDIGYTPELIRLIDIFIKDYGYTEILNQSLDSPYLTTHGGNDIVG